MTSHCRLRGGGRPPMPTPLLPRLYRDAHQSLVCALALPWARAVHRHFRLLPALCTGGSARVLRRAPGGLGHAERHGPPSGARGGRAQDDRAARAVVLSRHSLGEQSRGVTLCSSPVAPSPWRLAFGFSSAARGDDAVWPPPLPASPFCCPPQSGKFCRRGFVTELLEKVL